MTYPPSGSEFPDAQPWPGEQPAFGPGYPATPSYPAMGAYQPQPGGYQPTGYNAAPAGGYQGTPGYPSTAGYPSTPGYPAATGYPSYSAGPGYPTGQGQGYPAGPYAQGPYPAGPYAQGPYPGGPGYPPGFPAGPPPASNNTKWWLIGGLSLLVVLGLVIGGILWKANDPSASTAAGSGLDSSSSDEAQIRSLLTNLNSDGGDFMTSMRQHSCAKDQQLYDKIGTLGPIKLPSDTSSKSDATATISDIEVDGSKATAQLTTGSGSRPPVTLYFRKESGDWKICMSDSPIFKKVLGGN